MKRRSNAIRWLAFAAILVAGCSTTTPREPDLPPKLQTADAICPTPDSNSPAPKEVVPLGAQSGVRPVSQSPKFAEPSPRKAGDPPVVTVTVLEPLPVPKPGSSK